MQSAQPVARITAQPWLWAYLGTLTLAGNDRFTGQGAGEVLTAALAFGTFSVIVGIGQMYVITLGPGNVDLSIPRR